MPRMDKLSTYRTAWAETGASGRVIYASTTIVSWDADTITLRSGGWETVTTKRKMNQAARQFGLPFGVYPRDHDWYVTTPEGNTLPFRDGMTFSRHRRAAA